MSFLTTWADALDRWVGTRCSYCLRRATHRYQGYGWKRTAFACDRHQSRGERDALGDLSGPPR